MRSLHKALGPWSRAQATRVTDQAPWEGEGLWRTGARNPIQSPPTITGADTVLPGNSAGPQSPSVPICQWSCKSGVLCKSS